MKTTKHKSALFSLAALTAFAMSVGTACLSSPCIGAGALTESDVAVQAGGGNELWNSEADRFDSAVLSDLCVKLFGEDDPVEYIKTGWDADTASYVIASSVLREKLENESGLTVTLGGLQWSVASLTLAEIDDEEHAVATLYLTDALPKSMTAYYNNANDIKGINMYSRSTLRKTLLDRADVQLFADASSSSSFAYRYLVQPKNIAYQQNETMFGREEGWYNSPNDALGSLTEGWRHPRMEYQPGYTMNAETVKYEDWGEDYIWIPSITEVGASNGAADETCIWQLNKAMRSHTAGGYQANYAWYRSGNNDYLNRAYILHRDGRFYNELVTNTYTIRPAVHLDLSAANYGTRGVVLEEPQDVATAFNGGVQSLVDLEKAPYPNWYRKSIYSDDTKLKIEYETQAQTVGAYWVKITLLDSWVERAVQAASDACDAAGITGEEKAAYIARKTPRFAGEPNTADPAHAETENVRWIKHTVEKRKLPVPTGDALVYSGKVQTYLPALYDEAYMQVTGDNTGTNAGDYSFCLTLAYPQDSVWDDGSPQGTVQDVTVNWRIEKYKLVAKWVFGSDFPVFSVAQEFVGALQLDYLYLDADNNILAQNALKEGETYFIVAKLKDEDAGNFEFVDAYGNTLSDPRQSEPVSFVNKVQGSDVGATTGKGCGSAVSGGALSIAVLAGAIVSVFVWKKRKESKH